MIHFLPLPKLEETLSPVNWSAPRSRTSQTYLHNRSVQFGLHRRFDASGTRAGLLDVPPPMAKSKAKKTKGEAQAAGADRLAPALAAFERGDYPDARRLFDAQANDPDASEAEQRMAKKLRGATLLESGALYVGLACIGLYGLVILVGSFKQP